MRLRQRAQAGGARSRRSAPTTSAACCARRELLQAREDFAGRPDRRRRAARGRGRGDPRRRQDAARGRSAVGHRRGVPPRLVAHGLHLPARRDREGRRATSRSSSTTRRATSSGRPRRSTSARRCASTHTIFGEDFKFLQSLVDRWRDPEAHGPLAEHGPLPRRPRGASTRPSTPTSRSSGAT